MKTKQYAFQKKKKEFHLMSAPSVNFISKFLGAEVVRGRRLKDGCAYCRERENWIILNFKTGRGLFNEI